METNLKIYPSYAKINLGLRVVGKRPDGYHNLESIFQEISLCDEIVFQEWDRLVIETDHPTLAVDEYNLCHRAYRLLADEYGLKRGVKIIIKKKIPLGAGLGGGSSNAAISLKALAEIFQLDLTVSEFLKLATRLGSDVPFFILGKTALVKGRGEVVIPISFLQDYQICLVYPGFQISTAQIFSNFEMGLTKYQGNIKFEAVIFKIRSLEELNNYLFNDLESIVTRLYPEIKNIKRVLQNSGARFVSLSGSGSTVYGLFEKHKEIDDLKKEFPAHYQVFIARPRG